MTSPSTRDLVKQLTTGTRRAVGWGAGPTFTCLAPICPFAIDYLVDPDPAHHGGTQGGVTVSPPARLAAEVSANVVVVVFAIEHANALRQIAALGHLDSVIAFDPDVFDSFRIIRPGRAVENARALQQAVARLTWYHKIDLGGVITPGRNYDFTWAGIRRTRNHIPYAGKHVLDLASWDGMWAFEAEALGAASVVATDVLPTALPNFLLCRDALGSAVVPYYNVTPYQLSQSLAVERIPEGDPFHPRRFDIVQHLGLLYHLRDPLLSLSQARSMLDTGGHLLLETAAIPDMTQSYMTFNPQEDDRYRYYEDASTWWIPTALCLREMLHTTHFRVVQGTETMFQEHPIVARMALVAEAIAPDPVSLLGREMRRTFRNPGLDL